MSIIGSELLIGSSAPTDYTISRSLRQNNADSAYLTRTYSVAGNRRTFTISAWVKPHNDASNVQTIFGVSNGTGANWGALYFAGGTIIFTNVTGGPSDWQLSTNIATSDPTSWQHVLVSVDTTQATTANRIKLYVNGQQTSSFSTASYPTLNFDCRFNDNLEHTIGKIGTRVQDTDGGLYITEFYFIDGQALTPSSFGSVNTTTGQWIPAQYTGTYGTNGFYLNFSDNSNNTATTLGKDYSGNGNNFTPVNLSVTAGSGNDSFVDSPTIYGSDTGIGSEVRGNYATFDRLYSKNDAATLSQGNLHSSGTSSDYAMSSFAAPKQGKWYAEVQITSVPNTGGTQERIGITYTSGNLDRGYAANGQYYNGSSFVAFGSTWVQNDIIGVAVDYDNNQLRFYKNGVQQGTTQSITYTDAVFLCCLAHNTATTTYVANFGQRSFAYTAPSGFKAWCVSNFPDPTILDPSKYMTPKIYTGNGSTQTISGLSFSPDFVWAKSRSTISASSHALFDTVRGATKYIVSNAVGVETTNVNTLTAFNSDGFTLGSDNLTNKLSDPFVAWCWEAASSDSTNTSGSITSTIRANATSGFSIITYTGTGSNATIGHGLGVAPELIFIKRRTALTDPWAVYSKSLAATEYLVLNTVAAKATSTLYWNSTAPTSSVFSVGTAIAVNANTGTYVAYAFASVPGYCSIGTYTGNGNTDGTYVPCGFRPQFVLVKRRDLTSNWTLADNQRATLNFFDKLLVADLNNVESSNALFLAYSNGFKIHNNAANDINGNNDIYIYLAFAETPFKYGRGGLFDN